MPRDMRRTQRVELGGISIFKRERTDREEEKHPPTLSSRPPKKEPGESEISRRKEGNPAQPNSLLKDVKGKFVINVIKIGFHIASH